jgi:HCOMODA/2-hydroxy-3-carboxy-muconic semialdehyde decarboxylase
MITEDPPLPRVDAAASARLRRVARVVAAHRLSDAFGHVSVRLDDETFLITPPRPLGLLGEHDLPVVMRVSAEELAPGAPNEAWIHREIYTRRPEVGAIVRAQPRAVAAAVVAGDEIGPISGHGAVLGGTVPVFADSQLVRTAERARALADAQGDADVVALRGNGAVTVAATPEVAVALMWVLERTAEIVLASGGRAVALPALEQEHWRGLGPELLPRIYAYLEASATADLIR